MFSCGFIPQLNWKGQEIGCGAGVLTKAIAEKCSHSYLFPIDRSDNYLKKGYSNSNLNFYFCYGRHFELVVFVMVLIIIPNFKSIISTNGGGH